MIDKNKTLELRILTGIPASGKSTYAKKIALNDPTNWVIVNRDSIREGLGKYWVPTRESLVTNIENNMVEEALLHGFNVIVDATNLNKRDYHRWDNIKRRVLRKTEYKIVKTFENFEISQYKAIWRDIVRGLKFQRSVGFKVIMQFHNKYKQNA